MRTGSAASGPRMRSTSSRGTHAQGSVFATCARTADVVADDVAFAATDADESAVRSPDRLHAAATAHADAQVTRRKNFGRDGSNRMANLVRCDWMMRRIIATAW
jgi:hypothetical protein